MPNKKNYPFMCYDSVFKSVFMGNEDILSKMIYDITGENYKNILLETNELSINRFNEKFKKCDFIIRTNDNSIINLELNPKSYPGLIIKNLSYIFHLYKTNSISGESYNEDISVLQINLNNYDINDKPLSRYLIKEIEDNDVYTDSFEIMTLSIVKCKKMYYNNLDKEVPKYVLWGTFLSCMVEEKDKMESILNKLLSKKEVKIIMDKINSLSSDSLFMSELESQKWQDWEDKSIIKYEKQLAREEGLAEGRAEGVEQEKIYIKSMLKKNISYEDISDITGKSIEEIKNIEFSMDNN